MEGNKVHGKEMTRGKKRMKIINIKVEKSTQNKSIHLICLLVPFNN